MHAESKKKERTRNQRGPFLKVNDQIFPILDEKHHPSDAKCSMSLGWDKYLVRLRPRNSKKLNIVRMNKASYKQAN